MSGKKASVTDKQREGGICKSFFIMHSIQAEITGSSSESCTYIKDVPDSPPAVAMEVAEM